MDLKKLSEPFNPQDIHWRVGSTNKRSRQKQDKNAKATKGIALAYVDARDVMNRLDDVLGPENWQDIYDHTEPYICRIGIKIDGEWVWKSNGAGDTRVEAEKGAMSDAFKRAAVMWGIGRYLYDMPNIWVDLDQYENIEKKEYSTLTEALKRVCLENKYKAIKQKLTSCKKDELQGTWEKHIDEINEFPDAGKAALQEIWDTRTAE